jgi:hypothetical protein
MAVPTATRVVRARVSLAPFRLPVRRGSIVLLQLAHAERKQPDDGETTGEGEAWAAAAGDGNKHVDVAWCRAAPAVK